MPYTELIHKYLRHNKKFPHVWCPGCGNGIVLGALIRAFDKMNLDMEKVVLVSGIGCSSRLPVYVDCNTLHTTHGRALTFATGIKFARPELKVIVIMGDGDATAIGGNHLIHAARRNIDLTAIIINNNIYGMTGGQYSPATPFGAKAATAPYGNIEHPFNISELAAAAGATYVGRSTAFHAKLIDKLIIQAVEKSGFGVVEVITHCHTQYGRRNKTPTAVEMMKLQQEKAVLIEKAKKMSTDELKEKFTIGTLVDRNLPNYCSEYSRVRKAALSKTDK